MKYVFETPYVFEGKTYEEIEFDLANLKGSDISKAKKRFNSEGMISPFPTMDSDFCAILLSVVAKLPIEFFTEMPARDYCAVTNLVNHFLNSADSK